MVKSKKTKFKQFLERRYVVIALALILIVLAAAAVFSISQIKNHPTPLSQDAVLEKLQKHEEMSQILGVPVYFCHPYHSWEKGGVENTNKLIRRYVPKGTDISKMSEAYILMIETKLNTRPRKCLRFKTPGEVMQENNQLKIFQTSTITNELKQKIPSVALEGSG